MDELGKDMFPRACRGCCDNCFKCTRKIKNAAVPVLRRLAAERALKLQSIAKLQHDLDKIEAHLDTLLRK